MTAETVIRRYTFKLYPNRAQETMLVRQAALLASLWNAALEQRETQWAHECQRKARADRQGLSFYDQTRAIKHIRAGDPEFASMSSCSMGRCMEALDLAFKAFFRRARGGAGRASGYPRYKSPWAIETKRADCTIWHRGRATHQAPLSGSGWNLAASGKHWSLYSKGVPGRIRARGKFPAAPLDFRTAEIMRRGGDWYLSIVAVMAPRRALSAAAPAATVEFDLIDEFARVKISANGECLPGWDADFISADEQISPINQEVNEASAAQASELGADGRGVHRLAFPECAAQASELGADGRADPTVALRRDAAQASELGADGRDWQLTQSPSLTALGETDSIQSQTDRRFRKHSYRWRQRRRLVAKRQAREARRHKEGLHRWSTRLVEGVSALCVVCPPIRDNTQSARGDARRPGAAVQTVALLNRHVLAQAPAMAIQMLEYKAAEAGVPFAHVSPSDHALSVGRDLPAATKAVRMARAAIRKQKGLLHV